MPTFGSASLTSRAKLHPKLQNIVDEAIKEIDFKILDATRGRSAQEKAFKQGNTKAHFGDSAHNYVPAIAMDLFPAPYDWDNTKSFESLSVVILRIAKEKGIPLRWGGDWNMDGSKTTSDNWDKPHYELTPWRTWAKQSKLYED
jgi:peptidoglycan L-alanyl-D-glutamate endopeptidase CwlK